MTHLRPTLSLVLLAVWLLAWGEASPGILVLGIVVALGLPPATRRFWPDYPRVRARGALLRLLALFAYDVVAANLVVAKRILGPQARLNPCFVVVPVDIAQPLVTALFANMISLTPGTVSCNISGDGQALLVHVLHCEDAQGLVDGVKARYESRLKEVFGC